MKSALALTLVAFSSGCVFDTSNTAGLADETEPTIPDADPTTLDGDTDSLDGPIDEVADAEVFVPLADNGLIVRYFIDEAASMQTPNNLLDSAASPLSLPITYGQASYVDDGNRGLHWATMQSTGKAQINFLGTKLFTQLSPSTTVTMEVVVDIDNAGPSGSDSQITGFRGGNPDFMLTAVGNNTIRFFRPFGNLGATWANSHSQQRMVLHLVYNADEARPDSRIELYRDGLLLSKTQSSPPSRYQPVGLGGNDSLIIGNSPNQNRSIEGTVYYVAMYDVAMSTDEIEKNTRRLLANDDH